MKKKNIARIAVVAVMAGWMGSIALAPKGNGVLANAFPKDLLASKASCTTPEWPSEARRYEVQGVTVVHFQISESGAVEDAKVARSSSWRLLDEAALRSLVRCSFKPDLAEAKRHQVFPVQFVWTLAGTPAVRPVLVAGSCAASPLFAGFQPYIHDPTSSNGVLVRFLVNAAGKAFGVKAEAADSEMGRAAAEYIQSCAFAPDSTLAGERTDTLFGRVTVKSR